MQNNEPKKEEAKTEETKKPKKIKLAIHIQPSARYVGARGAL